MNGDWFLYSPFTSHQSQSTLFPRAWPKRVLLVFDLRIRNLIGFDVSRPVKNDCFHVQEK